MATASPPVPPEGGGSANDTTATPSRNLLAWSVQWYVHCFLTNFLTYVPLPLALLLCAAMLTNVVGEGYGVDKVVWHDDWWKQFFVGASLSLVASLVFFVGYLLWLRDLRLKYLKGDFTEVSYGRYSWQMLGCFLGTLLVIPLIAGVTVWAV